MEGETIYTYDIASDLVKAEHIFLNNFDPSDFIADDDFKYPSVEHYYQSHKFDNFDEKPEMKAVFDEVR